MACAFSGGPDSTALVALARHAGCEATAHHVDHGSRPESGAEADRAEQLARSLDVAFVRHSVSVPSGPNYEARARDARRSVLPDGALTGHTLDDQAETVLLRLLRGSGATGLGGIEAGPTHPILALRRADTEAVCAVLGVQPVRDPTNDGADAWRNRIRHELLPLAVDIAERDVAAIIARTAELLRDDDRLLDRLASDIDPTDARAVRDIPTPLARRALRGWLTTQGYPPDVAAVDRVLAVARGDAIACEIAGGRRIERSNQRLRIVENGTSTDRVDRRTDDVDTGEE